MAGGLIAVLIGCLPLYGQAPATPAPAPASAPAPAAAPAAAPAEAAPHAAPKHRSIYANLGAKIKEGGTTALVQLGLSVFGAAFALERFFNLRRVNVAPRGLSAKARKLWAEGKFEELENLGEQEPSTLARVISFIAKHREFPMTEVSVMAGDIVSQEMTVHQQRAYPLGVVATLEPLLGLLGMILGMISTFEVVAIAGALGDPTQLASGISEALVTTGLGLAVAIPFLALHHYFKHKVGMYSAIMEKEVTDLVSAWLMRKAHTPAPAPAPAKAA
jgi:biopolymer transport protein ExbB